jgi:hypothetical protein
MEQNNQGIICEWLADNKIVAYSLASAKLAALNAWSEVAMQTLAAWPKDRTYLALHDLSNPGVSLVYSTAVQNDIFNIGVTPGKRQAVNDLLDAYPDWKVALAVVISASYSGSITKLKASSKGAPDLRVHTKAFFDRDYAIAWLLQFANTNLLP